MSQLYFHPAQQSTLNPHGPHPSTASGHNGNHHHHHPTHHHGGRSRRTPRYGSSNNSHKQFRNNNRHHKENAEAAHAAAFRKDFEAARSFELEDDEVFCPWHLLTDDDLHSIHSSSSERSSSSGESPDSSPLQPQLHPTANLHPSPAPHVAANATNSFQQGTSSHLKIHQPLAQRARNAIPIVDPNSRTTSPPNSISPARQVQKPYAERRW